MQDQGELSREVQLKFQFDKYSQLHDREQDQDYYILDAYVFRVI